MLLWRVPNLLEAHHAAEFTAGFIEKFSSQRASHACLAWGTHLTSSPRTKRYGGTIGRPNQLFDFYAGTGK